MKYKSLLIAICLASMGLFLRSSVSNSPFWVDEFSTAEQAKLILKYGPEIFSQTSNYFEAHNITTHLIVAFSFQLFGVGEMQARIPFILIGSIVAIIIFLLSKKMFNQTSAIAASLLYSFSYWQITWAQQARGYVLQQLLLLASIYVYLELLRKFSKTKLAIFILFSLLGILTHTTFILLLSSLFLHFLIFRRQYLFKVIKNPFTYIFSLILFLTLYFSGQITSILNNLLVLLSSHPNNVAYYHSFLWREQTIITLLAFLGTMILIFKQKKFETVSLLLIPIFAYLFFLSFMFSPYVSRYLLPIFPLLIILAGVAISSIAENVSKERALIFSLIITFFIVVNGDKFTLLRKPFYSVNHDMREIALIDYDQVYEIIKTKGELIKGETAVIDTWPDRMKWYLGANQDFFYTFRWIDSPGLVNGLSKSTPYVLNEENEKIIPRSGVPPIKLIGELSDLQKAMSKYPKGFIWIDDASLPADVINYATENFKEELYLDHYPLDDNPYSIWPGTLYSWGFEEDVVQ